MMGGAVALANVQVIGPCDGARDVILGARRRLIKGQVFLWKDGQSWEALWDLDGEIAS